MGSTPTVPAVLEYVLNKPGTVVTCSDIMTATGLTEKQVQAAMVNARTRHGYGETIEVIFRGRQWRYMPHKGKTDKVRIEHQVFERIGTTREGHAVLQCEDGTLWKAEQL